MIAFHPGKYGPVLEECFLEPPRNPLDAGTPNSPMKLLLKQLTVRSAFAHTKVHDADLAAGCVAGAWLYHDFLEECHVIAQEIRNPSGSFWHAIMHRREKDYGNSKYWFRQVGVHPIFESIRFEAKLLAVATDTEPSLAFMTSESSWDPFQFVDLVQRCHQGLARHTELCRTLQYREWILLFDYCYQLAVGQRWTTMG